MFQRRNYRDNGGAGGNQILVVVAVVTSTAWDVPTLCMEPLALAASLNRKTEDDYACDVTSRGPCSVVRKSVLEYVIRILSKAYVMRLFQVHVWFTASQHANTLKPRRLAGSLRSLSRPAVLLSTSPNPRFPHAAFALSTSVRLPSRTAVLRVPPPSTARTPLSLLTPSVPPRPR